jgi:5-methylcytosine-specific restriction enzyme A
MPQPLCWQHGPAWSPGRGADICSFHKAPGEEWQFIQRTNLVLALELLGIVSGAHAPMQEEIPAFESLAEGAAYTVQVNAYERNDKARKAAIQHHSLSCGVCGFKFAEVYGPDAENYIQVHHLVPLSSIKQTYQIDPVKDLLPVCANCHAVIHLRNPPFTPSEVRAMLTGQQASPNLSS